jgi:hypothetical protein
MGRNNMNVKEAVEKSKAEIVSLLGSDGITDIRLEEVESKMYDYENSSYWIVTFSYLPKEIDPLSSLRQQRIYKTILVDDSGNFLSMKIRELAQV